MRDEVSAGISNVKQNINYRLIKIAAIALLAIGISIVFYRYSSADKIRYGKLTPDIELPTPEGEFVQLASLKGKVVLVEFWASWCAVCRDKNCHVYIPLYQSYHEQGFEIFGVSMDTERSDWINGISRDNLPWINVSVLGGFNSTIAAKYKVTKIPMTYLLDRNGKLIATNLSKDDLLEQLNQLL